MPDVTFDNDVTGTSLSELAYIFRSADSIQKYIFSIFGPMQDIENSLKDLYTKIWFLSAEGLQLDNFGTIVGQKRRGMTDLRYKLALITKIAQNNSKGQFSNFVVTVFQLLTGSTSVHVIEAYPASVSFVGDQNINGFSQEEVLEAMQTVVSAGINVYGVWFGGGAENKPFSFAGNPIGGGFGTDGQVGVGGHFI